VISDCYPATESSKIIGMREVHESASGVPHILSLNCHSVPHAHGSPLTDAHVIHDQHRVPGRTEHDKALVLIPTVGIGQQPNHLSAQYRPRCLTMRRVQPVDRCAGGLSRPRQDLLLIYLGVTTGITTGKTGAAYEHECCDFSGTKNVRGKAQAPENQRPHVCARQSGRPVVRRLEHFLGSWLGDSIRAST